MEEISKCETNRDDTGAERAWKLFSMLAILLLHLEPGSKTIRMEELRRRFDLFSSESWVQLLTSEDKCKAKQGYSCSGLPLEEDRVRRRKLACDRVRQEECTKARQVLTNSALAPGNAATLAELRDKAKRSSVATEPIPAEVLEF